jgi:hypothetical protein
MYSDAESCYAGIKNPIDDDSEFNPMFTSKEIREMEEYSEKIEAARIDAESAMGRLQKINPDFCDDCGKTYDDCFCSSTNELESQILPFTCEYCKKHHSECECESLI